MKRSHDNTISFKRKNARKKRKERAIIIPQICMDANRLFDTFVAATSFTKIQQLFAQLCALLDIDPYDNFNVFKRLKTELNDWRAQKLWSLLEKRAEQREYCHQKACERLSVLVIGAGPCGLRSAIECAFLGAYVVLVEQRDCFSRNNVLHIWPFVIEDLKNLGIKIFYPKFCRGSIDHISIRQLQIFLVKIALVLGVQIHNSITFHRLIFPKLNENGIVEGWRAEFDPPRHILSDFVFDALIGADGKRNTVPGFPKRELRGKLAIGITANFVNQRTLAEEKVQEISGVAYIFNQQFFKDMKEVTGVDLENIVYYKDETHYFVMCAKKQSLLEKGVIIEDNEDVSLLLSPDNINQEKLCDYAAEAADFATGGNLPSLKYARNHNGSEDIAMFDFTSLFSAQCSVRLVERYDRRLLMSIVGDSLHEPFWPTGSGCARGFLSVFDAVWMLRSYGINIQGLTLLLAERESVYRLLAQAKPDNLHKQTHKYTIDPRTRYISLEMTVQPHEINHLIDTDNPRNVEINQALPLRAAEAADCVSEAFIKRYKLWKFCHQALGAYHLHIFNFLDCWNDGRALAALLGKFRPDLVDYLSLCAVDDPNTVIQKIFATVKEEYDIEPPCKNHAEWVDISTDARIVYIGIIVEALKNDSQRMRETLMNAIRTSTISHKRKTRQVNASHAEKTESIRYRASNLLNAFSSTSVLSENMDKQDVDVAEIRNAATELNNDEKFGYSKSCKRLDRNVLIQSIMPKSSKYQTKRPTVEKLNPERLYAVERIVSGELQKEKAEEVYRNKQRLASVFTRKMDRRDIDEMKLKLEQTAMGLLFNKEQYRVLTSKEEKIICTNAAAARRTVSEGFKHANEKYKEIDEKLSKAETLLKNQNLVGIDIVSRTKNKNTINDGSKLINAGKSPPPLPPKKAISQENRMSSSTSHSENHNTPFRDKLSSSSNPSRLLVSATQLSCDSVNGRRQMICQLCLKVVYLAERMQVEGMFIHKKCFRCAFCGQPLRLGNCAQDRNLRKFNPRFFCMQHVNLPVLEKIARIEKNGYKANDTAEPYLPTLNNTMVNLSGYATSLINQSTAVPAVQQTGRNSPTMLLVKTMEKMRAQKEAIDILSSHRHVTEERAKFEIYCEKTATKEKTALVDSNRIYSNGHDNFSDEELLEDKNKYLSFDNDEDEDNDRSNFMEDELFDLESAVLENLDNNINRSLTEAQALKLLKTFKERRRKFLKEHQNTLLLGRKCEKGGENFDATVIKSRNKMIAKLKEISAPFMEIKEQGCVTPKLRTDEELELCKSSKRHSIPKQSSKGVFRFSRNLSLDLIQNDNGEIYGTIDRITNFVRFSFPSSNDCSQETAAVHSQPITQTNLSLLSQMSSVERIEALQRTDKTDQIINCFENSDGITEGSNLHDTNIKNEKNARSSSLRILRKQKEERVLSRCASTPAFQALSTLSAKKHATFHQTATSSSHCAVISTSINSSEKLSPTLLTTKDIRRVQKLAEKILHQKEQERISAAQDMQRELEEIDVRKLEVKAVAGDLERRLRDDAENLWILEQWLLYVQEMAQLKQREEELKLRVFEFEVNEEYKSLQLELKKVQNIGAGVLLDSNCQAEKSIMKKALAILEMRDAIQKQLKVVRERAWQQKVPEPAAIIELKGASYRNFKPIFI
ncbi:[F-actin]-monooxygenase MICAL2 [Dirofilaria immitis]